MSKRQFIVEDGCLKAKGKEILDYCDKKPIAEKKMILEYFSGIEPDAFGSVFYDPVTVEKAGDTEKMYQDGGFVWYESIVYNFRVHNLHLKDDFIAFVGQKEGK